MTAAQKKAQDNFKKAIAYRKKTGCTLKQAFAHVKSGKVSGLDKVIKKGSKTTVLYTKKAKKKAASKKKASQGVLFGIKKKAAKKPSEKAILKKVHNAKTTSKTLFNKLDKLDEAQHAHMSIGSTKKRITEKLSSEIGLLNLYTNELNWWSNYKSKFDSDKKVKVNNVKFYKNLIVEIKQHVKELKKLI